MHIQALASTVSDNFFYLITDGDDALLVDPVDADVAIAAARASGAGRIRILATHGHPDHIAGNDAVVEALGCEVLAAAQSTMMPIRHDVSLRDGDSITIGESRWSAYHAPGHTSEHMVLYSNGHLLSGDVLFVAGVGNCRFGGDVAELYATVALRVSELPGETVFYPGHDYAVRNLEFTLWIEPSNAAAARLYETASKRQRADGPTLTTLTDEREYNLFMRTHDPAVQALVFDRSPDFGAEFKDPSQRCFHALRMLRDGF